jgi:hypothetical protein
MQQKLRELIQKRTLAGDLKKKPAETKEKLLDTLDKIEVL